MERYFSPSTGAFYVAAVHGPRMVEVPRTEEQIKAQRRAKMVPNPATKIPLDAVPVDEAAYTALMTAQAEGQMIIARGGAPTAVAPLPAEPAVQLDIIRARRNRLLAATDMMAALSDYPISSAQRTELIAWRAALRDVTASIDGADPAGSVDWPVPPIWLEGQGVIL
jgi:hypothetical protein